MDLCEIKNHGGGGGNEKKNQQSGGGGEGYLFLYFLPPNFPRTALVWDYNVLGKIFDVDCAEMIQ